MLPSVGHCKNEFERGRRLRGSEEPLWVNDLRWEALDAFLHQGFPAAPAPIADTLFGLGSAPTGRRPLEHADWPDTATAVRLVFVNGHYAPDASDVVSLPEGALVGSLPAVLRAHAADAHVVFGRVAPFWRDPFVALNTALFMDAACVLIPPGAVVEQPIHLQFVSTGEADLQPAMSHPRGLIVLGDESRATILESYVGRERVQYLTNGVTEVVLSEGAALEHYRVQRDSVAAYHVGATYVSTATRAAYHLHSTTIGGAFVRQYVQCRLAQAQARCSLDGLFLADGERHVEVHATIEHAAAACRSRHALRGVLADRATAVIDGRSVVPAAMDATETHTDNQVIIVSPDAVLDARSPTAVSVVDGDMEARRRAARACLRSSLDSVHPPDLAREIERLLRDAQDFFKPSSYMRI